MAKAARGAGFTSAERAGGLGGAPLAPPSSIFDYKGFELFLVAQTGLHVLGVGAAGERPDAHVEESLGGAGAHDVGRESLALEARDHGVGAGLVLERPHLDRERAAGGSARLGRRAGFGRRRRG